MVIHSYNVTVSGYKVTISPPSCLKGTKLSHGYGFVSVKHVNQKRGDVISELKDFMCTADVIFCTNYFTCHLYCLNMLRMSYTNPSWQDLFSFNCYSYKKSHIRFVFIPTHFYDSTQSILFCGLTSHMI